MSHSTVLPPFGLLHVVTLLQLSPVAHVYDEPDATPEHEPTPVGVVLMKILNLILIHF